MTPTPGSVIVVAKHAGVLSSSRAVLFGKCGRTVEGAPTRAVSVPAAAGCPTGEGLC
jgi:hypothetical protein